jgi:hypothetical protein
MTATVTSHTHPVETVDLPSPAVRIRLKPRSDHRGMVDGAWWPRSRDLTRELPPLIAALEREQGWGPIHHVTVNVRMWPDIAKKVPAGNHVVRLGWFDAEQDPHDICLLSLRQHGRWDLLVVPPELDPAAALPLMVTASTPGTSQTASALLAAAMARTVGPTEDSEGLGAWESEGGSRRRFGDEHEEPSKPPNPHASLMPVAAVL